MSGFNQLVDELEKAFPDDWWIASRRKSHRISPNAFPQVQVYESALRKLDDESWKILSKNAHMAFSEPRGVRGKSNFFSLLNEAIAYEYLFDKGYRNVRLLRPMQNKKTPDLSYETNSGLHYCEVKTILVSQLELERKASGDAFCSSIYCRLNQEFLGKLSSTIQKAVTQIQAVSGSGLVYLIAQFDDGSLDYYDAYQEQITELLIAKFPIQKILIRIGVSTARYIRHGID